MTNQDANGDDRDALLADQLKHTIDLNAYYEKLAFELNDGDKGHFLSGWQCGNPFATEFLDAVRERAKRIDYQKYTYFDDDDELARRIGALHKAIDGVQPQCVLCGSGTTALLFAFVTYLQKIGVEKIHFIPPLYFTLHRAFAWYKIRAIPVSTQQPFEDGFSLNLPDENNSVLLLTDPVWYTGTPVPSGIIDEIAEWQQRTSSTVFVDGSLQYLPWNGVLDEPTARLSPSLTFRLICPSKQLSAHGYRFSYVLLPSAAEQNLAWTYSNIYGPASADSIAFAHEAVAAIANGSLPRKLTNLVAERHRYLREGKIIESELTPTCGYFVFEKINAPLPEGYKLIDGRFFDQKNYLGYTKINLLSPSLRLLSQFIR
jgi:aspartate/methionine/tyrosine aminotransferase